MTLPKAVELALSDPVFHRVDGDIEGVLKRLGVNPSRDFGEFYSTFIGPFWSKGLGIELADIIDGESNIESLTIQCRSQFGFPNRMLVLTDLSAGDTVHVLDAETDQMFVVDFEGGEELLIRGQLEPRWMTFADFIQAYFS